MTYITAEEAEKKRRQHKILEPLEKSKQKPPIGFTSERIGSLWDNVIQAFAGQEGVIDERALLSLAALGVTTRQLEAIPRSGLTLGAQKNGFWVGSENPAVPQGIANEIAEKDPRLVMLMQQIAVNDGASGRPIKTFFFGHQHADTNYAVRDAIADLPPEARHETMDSLLMDDALKAKLFAEMRDRGVGESQIAEMERLLKQGRDIVGNREIVTDVEGQMITMERVFEFDLTLEEKLQASGQRIEGNEQFGSRLERIAMAEAMQGIQLGREGMSHHAPMEGVTRSSGRTLL